MLISCCSTSTLVIAMVESSCVWRDSRDLPASFLVVTAGVEKEQTPELIRSGISGIFMKHDSASLLIEGIREVLAGKVWFDQPLLQEAMGRVGSQESKAERFTERERHALSYLFDGLVT